MELRRFRRAAPGRAHLATALVLAALLVPLARADEPYRPLFTDEAIQKAPPQTRERMRALERLNRKRWLERGGTAPAATGAGSAAAAAPAATPPPAAPVVRRAGKYYRWTDATGTVHLSDTPPPDGKAEEHDLPTGVPTPPAPGATGARESSDARLGQVLRGMEATRQDREVAQHKADEKRRANCEKARAQVRFFEKAEGARLRHKSADGTEHYISDADRARLVEAAKRAERQLCGP